MSKRARDAKKALRWAKRVLRESPPLAADRIDIDAAKLALADPRRYTLAEVKAEHERT